MVNTIILAGKQEIKGSHNGTNKALLRINGTAMIQYVVDAVKGAEGIEKIAVLGPVEDLERPLSGKVDAIIEASGSVTENILAGLRHLGFDKHLLICTSDIPLITPEAINDFLHKAEQLEADFCYPIIEKQLNSKKFPEMERTYVKVKEGLFTGGNIFYVNPLVVESRIALVDKLIDARKNPAKMAKLLSVRFMLQLLTGSLSIKKAEERVSKLMHIKARAVVSEYPEIGNDVDKPNDITAAAAYLSQ